MKSFFARLIITSLFVLSTLLLGQTTGASGPQERDRGLKIRVGASSGDVKSGRPVQLWAVIIGVSRYLNGDQDKGGNVISNLKNASDDAYAIAEFLRSPEGGGFPDDHIKFLTDEQATKAEVEKALAWLKSQAKEDDYFVIYIAAHGALLQTYDSKINATVNLPYFLFYDTDLSKPDTALMMTEFPRTVDQLRAKKGLVLSDTCYSGGVQLAGRGTDESVNTNQRYLDEMSKIPAGVGFISAARPNEKSYEEDAFNHGVFTYCLLDGLGGIADKNQDEQVTFDEIIQHLEESVPVLTQNKQHPHWNATTIETNDLPLSAVTYANMKAAPAGNSKSNFGLLKIRVPDLEGVEVAIDDDPKVMLNRTTPRTFKVPIGQRRIKFVKGSTERTLLTKVEPDKLHPFTVNFAFSESNSSEDSLIEPTTEQVQVFMQEREPAAQASKALREGVTLFNKLRYKESIAQFNSAIAAAGGQYAEALVYRGRAEQSLGMSAEAVKSFQAALNIRPSDFETQALLAEARFNTGTNLDQIQKDLRGIINRHPDFAFARVVLADVLLYQDRPRQAEYELKRAISYDPNYPAAYLVLADSLTHQPSLEKQKEAIKMAEKALMLFSKVSQKRTSASTSLKRLSISNVIFGGGRYSDDKVMAEATHMLGKTRTRLVEYYSNSLSDQQKNTYLDEARRELAEAMRLATKSADKRRLALVLETSAGNYFFKGDMASAIKDAREAIKVSDQIADMKDFSDPHLTLARAYESSQDFAKAADHLKKYISLAELEPEDRTRKQEKLVSLTNKARANGQIK
jgi:tetratricopeptide (TPR) repeat protein